MLVKARGIAMTKPGYISTETLSNFDDPNTVLLLSMWQTKEDWDNYKNSAERQENERLFAEILEGETQYDIYKLGL